MAEKEDNAVTQDDNASKNCEENFKEEIKDYAKTTMNELLGMFGYDDEITSESVDSLDIKVPGSIADGPKVITTATTAPLVVMTTAEMLSTPVTMTSVSMVTTLPVVIPVSDEESSSDTPIIVKVEGNTSVNDIIRQQNNAAAATVSPSVSKNPDTAVAKTTPGTQSTTQTPSTATSTSKSTAAQPAQPALAKRPITTQSSSSSKTKVVHSSTAPVVKTLSLYLQYTRQQNQQNRPCTWCKKTLQLKNFTFREGARVLECRGICSEDCFENAALSIDVNNDNIKGIQQRIRELRSSRKTKLVSVSMLLFDWENYLKTSESKGAPWTCFKQSATPPHNCFKPGMKLEVSDPRIIKSTCLATVVGSIGPRIRCRFDGTDKTNDVWHMVDSTEIHPVGWCEANDGILQPPVGFRLDPGSYQTFIAKSQASDSPESIKAPARIFKKEPATPGSNMFIPGMKLEALDPKNQVLICVASVGKVDGDKLRIDFDGYLGSDYWCRFDSRNIFPVGWCAMSGHPLQPPGNSKAIQRKLQNANRAKTLKEPEEPAPKTTKPHPKASPSLSSASTSSHHPASPSQDSKTTSTSSVDVEPSPLYRVSFPTVCVYVNHGCKVGQHLNPLKVDKILPTHWRGCIVDVLKPCLQGIVDCAYEQPTVFGFLRPGHGKTCIVAQGANKTLSCVLQNIDRVRIFWKVLERFIEDLRCCENLVSSIQIHGRCGKCRGKSVAEPSLRVKRVSTEASEAPARKTSKLNTQDSDDSTPQVCSTSPAKTWTVDEVIKYIENTELADHITLFKTHEIDGRALLLLNRDMIMSYMGLKLGPAIKLLNIVQELKPKQVC